MNTFSMENHLIFSFQILDHIGDLKSCFFKLHPHGLESAFLETGLDVRYILS